jgi:hypothetical protein
MDRHDHAVSSAGPRRASLGRLPARPSREPSRLDRLMRLKLAGRDPERRSGAGSLHEWGIWIALALLLAAALASPVRAAAPADSARWPSAALG